MILCFNYKGITELKGRNFCQNLDGEVSLPPKTVPFTLFLNTKKKNTFFCGENFKKYQIK